MFDTILGAQFTPHVAHTLEILLGRLLFRVRQHDNWEVVPFLYGAAGTGKSTFLEVVTAMHGAHQVGTISSTFEPTFGLEALHDKFVVMCREDEQAT